MRRAAAFTAALLLGLVPGVGAQQLVDPSVQADPTGFHVGLSLDGSGIGYEGESGTDSGIGLSLKLGYAPSPFVTLFARAHGSSVAPEDGGDDYTLSHFDVGIRGILHAPTRRFAPFAEVMFTGRAIELDLLGSPLTSSSTGLGGTVGAMVFLTPSVALDLGFTFTGGTFGELEWEGETERVDQAATSARISIGLSWWSR